MRERTRRRRPGCGLCSFAHLVVVLGLCSLPLGALGAVPKEPEIPPHLDLTQALEIARTRGLDVLTAEAAVKGAQGDLDAAGAVANPVVSGTYGWSHSTGTCTSGGATVPCPSYASPALFASVSDSAAILDLLIGKRVLRQAAAKGALESARASRLDAVRVLEGAVAQQFVQVVLAKQSLAFDRDVSEAQARSAALVKARFDAGAVSEADVARVETARLEADQAVDQAQSSLETAQAGLSFLLGVRGTDPEYDLVEGDVLSSREPPALAGLAQDMLLTRALKSRPDIAAARAAAERAQSAIELATRQQIPDVTLEGSYSQQGSGDSVVTPPTFTFGISLPIPILYQQRGEIARARADLDTQEVALARAEASVVQDLKTSWSAYRAAGALVRRMDGGLLERAHTALDLVTIQYQKGAASLLDLLDAQRTYTAIRLEYLQDLAGYRQAAFRLQVASGALLP